MARNTKSVSTSSVVLNVVALEQAAVAAFQGIESGMSAASKAVLAYVLGCKEAKVTPAVFEAGIARISDSIPGVLKVTAGAYISNAKRIFAADEAKLEEAKKSAGTDSIKALAAACPAVSKKGGGTKGEAAKKPDAPKVDLVATKTPATSPMLALQNDLVALRKLFANKKAAIALIGEMEDMLDDLKKLAA
jgi:hypothetical protein